MLASSIDCVVYIRMLSDNNGAIVEPTQLAERRCSILEKLTRPPTKSDLVRKRKTESGILNLQGLTRKTVLGIVATYAPMLEGTYYA